MVTSSILFQHILTPQILVQAGVIILLLRFLAGLAFLFCLISVRFHLINLTYRAVMDQQTSNSSARIMALNMGEYTRAQKRRSDIILREPSVISAGENRVSPNYATEIIYQDFFNGKSKPFPVKKVYYKNFEKF